MDEIKQDKIDLCYLPSWIFSSKVIFLNYLKTIYLILMEFLFQNI